MKVPTLPSTVDAIISDRSSSGDRRSDAYSRSFPESLLEVRNSLDEDNVHRRDSTDHRRDSEIEDEDIDSPSADDVSESPPNSRESTDLEAEQVTEVANAARAASRDSIDHQQAKQSQSKRIADASQFQKAVKDSAQQRVDSAAQSPPGQSPPTPQKTVVTPTSDLSQGSTVTLGSSAAEGEKNLSTPPRGAALADGSKAISTAVSPLAGLSADGKQSWFESNRDASGGASPSSFHILGRTNQHSLSEGALPAYLAVEAEVTSPNQRATSEGISDSPSKYNPSPTPTVRSDAAKLEGLNSAPSEVIQADSLEPPELARKIYRLVRRSLARGDQQLKIRLDPPRMGRVDVDLRLAEEQLGIRFTVDTEEVREVLRSHLDELHRSLGEHGWSANSVEVDLKPADREADQGESSSSGENSGEGSDELEEVEDIRELRLWHLGKAVDLRG